MSDGSVSQLLARCGLCGARGHHESHCPDRPGDAVEQLKEAA